MQNDCCDPKSVQISTTAHNGDLVLYSTCYQPCVAHTHCSAYITETRTQCLVKHSNTYIFRLPSINSQTYYYHNIYETACCVMAYFFMHSQTMIGRKMNLTGSTSVGRRSPLIRYLVIDKVSRDFFA